MRAKVAKALRREAQASTVGRPERGLVAVRRKATVTSPETGKPVVVQRLVAVVHPKSTRAAYRALKEKHRG